MVNVEITVRTLVRASFPCLGRARYAQGQVLVRRNMLMGKFGSVADGPRASFPWHGRARYAHGQVLVRWNMPPGKFGTVGYARGQVWYGGGWTAGKFGSVADGPRTGFPCLGRVRYAPRQVLVRWNMPTGKFGTVGCARGQVWYGGGWTAGKFLLLRDNWLRTTGSFNVSTIDSI